ncbi:DNA-directed RNA polymerase subunit beta', partial [Bienertia sinuspersici]
MFNNHNTSISIPVSDEDSDEYTGRMRARVRKKRKKSQNFRLKAEFTRRLVRNLANWWPLLLCVPAMALLLFEVSRLSSSHHSYSVSPPTKKGFHLDDKNLNRIDPIYHTVGGVKERCLPILSDEDLELLDIPSAKGSKGPVKKLIYISEDNMRYAGDNSTFSQHNKEAGRFNLFTGYQSLFQREKSFKMLPHRLFPNAQYSIWVDSKSQLRRDPLGVLEALLWRSNSVLAISQHGARSSVYDEAKAVVKKNKATPEEVDVQITQYRLDGLPEDKRFNGKKALSEASIIVREHTPLTNLFMCLWFNEVVRFTSRDQLSFPYVLWRLKVLNDINMFPVCTRKDLVNSMGHIRKAKPLSTCRWKLRKQGSKETERICKKEAK